MFPRRHIINYKVFPKVHTDLCKIHALKLEMLQDTNENKFLINYCVIISTVDCIHNGAANVCENCRKAPNSGHYFCLGQTFTTQIELIVCFSKIPGPKYHPCPFIVSFYHLN